MRDEQDQIDELLCWRSAFPILDNSTYLISHSMGTMPRAATDWLRKYTQGWQQEGSAVWDRWMGFFEEIDRFFEEIDQIRRRRQSV